MNKKKKLIINTLWWLDYSVLGLDTIKFKYSQFNNIFYLNLINFYYFFLINKFSLYNLYFYNLDGTVVQKNYFLSIQTIFYDLQVLLTIKFKNNLFSISKIYFGNTWVERELKEFTNIQIINLLDNRKLLSNYNYNNNLEYNHFNLIINDIKI